MSRTYKGIIEKDFNQVKNIINTQTIKYDLDYKNIFKKLKVFHDYFYKLRDILEELNYQNDESYNAIRDGVEGMFDFIWLINLSRYKACVITFRSSIEILVKGLMREYCPEKETDKFSNNIEIIIKQLKLEKYNNFSLSKDKKNLSNFLEKNYTSKIRDLYKKLSEIVHGKYSNENKKVSEYLQEVTQVNINYSESQCNYTFDKCIELLRFILELAIMVNFQYLQQNMNDYKLSLILESLSSEFNTFKNDYL